VSDSSPIERGSPAGVVVEAPVAAVPVADPPRESPVRRRVPAAERREEHQTGHYQNGGYRGDHGGLKWQGSVVLRYAEPDYSDEHDQNAKEVAAGQTDIVTPGNLAPRLICGERGWEDGAITRCVWSCLRRARCKSPELFCAQRGDPVVPGGRLAKCGAR